MFYASVHFGPTNSIWQDFNVLNSYITRCQSFFQSGTTDNDLLLYFPVYDAYSEYGRSLLRHFHGKLEGQHVAEVAEYLIDNGFSFDYISDKYLAKATVKENTVMVGSGKYKGILVPKVDYLPLETYKTLIKLAEAGVEVYFEGGLPADVPGLYDLEKRREELKNITNSLQLSNFKSIERAKVGSGTVSVSDSLGDLFLNSKIIHETITEKGLSFVRMDREDGKCYFILNNSNSVFDGWLPIARELEEACLFNPMTGVFGKAKCGANNDVYIQLQPGESIIVQLLNGKCKNQDYPIWEMSGEPMKIDTDINLTFISGGSTIPPSRSLDSLISWTKMTDAEYFSGTAKYELKFKIPNNVVDGYYLDLGDVRESARVVLNGEEVTTFIKAPFACYIETNKFKIENVLEVFVTNQMVNRMIELDRKDSGWKKFYNINFPGRRPESKGEGGLLTTINWNTVASGLLGTVTITPALRK